MNPRVTAAVALDDRHLQLQFSNGEQRRLDLQPYLAYPVFERLREPARSSPWCSLTTAPSAGRAASISIRTRSTWTACRSRTRHRRDDAAGATLQAREPRARYLAVEQPALVREFELLATAPGGVGRLRDLILSLAVQGKLLTRRDALAEPASRC
jgi:hypothetical protein